MSIKWAFDSTKNKHSLYRGKDYVKKFCISLREHAANVINFEKKKMLLLTEKELKLHQDAIQCYISRKAIPTKKNLNIKIKKNKIPFSFYR